MTGRERIVKAESIMRRQNSGKITPWQASEEFDMLMMAEGGGLLFYGDTTNHVAPWDADVIQFSKSVSEWIPSNSGIYARGPKRGMFTTYPEGQASNCHPDFLKHFGKGAAQRPHNG